MSSLNALINLTIGVISFFIGIYSQNNMLMLCGMFNVQLSTFIVLIQIVQLIVEIQNEGKSE